MRIADLTSGAARLNHALRTLRAHWEQTQTEWSDPVSRRFDEEFMAPLEPLVTASLDQLAALSQVLTTAEQDCS